MSVRKDSREEFLKRWEWVLGTSDGEERIRDKEGLFKLLEGRTIGATGAVEHREMEVGEVLSGIFLGRMRRTLVSLMLLVLMDLLLVVVIVCVCIFMMMSMLMVFMIGLSSVSFRRRSRSGR